MEEIKNFITEFANAEAAAGTASVKPDLTDFNKKLDFMNTFAHVELQNNFGLIPQTELDDADFYERWKNASPQKPRRIFKISHYKNDIYSEVYAVYTSSINPRDIIFSYGECLIVARINGVLQIIKRYAFGDPMNKKSKFKDGLGVEDLSNKKLKKPIAIERYMEPKHDIDGMEHYNRDI